MSYLVLVRHGESRWNLANVFTGWVDVPLSENGIKEALTCAAELRKIEFDVAYTSLLRRAQETLLLILANQDRTGIFMHGKEKWYSWSYKEKRFKKHDLPIYSSDKLNERYYGRLQGLNKTKTAKRYGEDKVFHWRRGFKDRPPGGESLADVVERLLPYFRSNIFKKIAAGNNVIVSAHGNSLRAMIKYIEKIPDDKIPFLELPEGKPIIYKMVRGKLKMMNHVFDYNRRLR